MREVLGKDAPVGRNVGESWEVSGWGDSQTVVSTGEYAGLTLGELLALSPEQLVGHAAASKKHFPLLFKFIDARQNLSIQVHPNSEQARRHGWGDCGKTEAWYVVDADKGAQIALGFNHRGVTREELGDAVRDGTVESLMNFIPVKRRDAFFIPAGTVHAILGGVLIYEVQEESNTTLRLYDWNRLCLAGHLRELQIYDALEIINFDEKRPLHPAPVLVDGNDSFRYETLCTSTKFIMNRYSFSKAGKAELETINGFRVMSVTAGAAEVTAGDGCAHLTRGQSLLVPSGLSEVRIYGDGGADILVTTSGV